MVSVRSFAAPCVCSDTRPGMRLPLVLVVAGLLLAALGPVAAGGSTDLTGSWEVSFDCDIFATATSLMVARPAPSLCG